MHSHAGTPPPARIWQQTTARLPLPRRSFGAILLLLIATAGLAGCAAPRYQTTHHYDPPKDAAGLACLETCTQAMSVCQQVCGANLQACRQRIEPEVEKRHELALKHYEEELERYRWELEQYAWSLNWGRMSWLGPRLRHPWPGYNFYLPFSPPTMPSRDSIFNRLLREQCTTDCGCQPAYDSCFLACGGKRTPEVKCIANCPERK